MDYISRDFLNLYGSFLFLIVGLLFTYQTWKKNRNTPLLTTGFFVAFIGQFFVSLLNIQVAAQSGFFWNLDIRTQIAFQIIFITMVNAILVFFWLFLELSNSVTVNRNALIVIVTLFTVYLWTFFFGLISLPLDQFESVVVFGNFAFSLLLNVVTFRSVYILYNVYLATGKEKTALLQLISFVLIEFWAINAMIVGTLDLYSFQFSAQTSYPDLVALFDSLYYIGLLIFIGTIIINPDYVYRLPLNIQDLVFLTNVGTAVFGIGKNADQKSLDEQLLAGFITASNSFISEMQPKLENDLIEIIVSKGRRVRIEFGKQLGICLVSLKENHYLIKSMRDLLTYIEKTQDMDVLDMGMFFEDELVISWLKKFFPYLDIENMQIY